MFIYGAVADSLINMAKKKKQKMHKMPSGMMMKDSEMKKMHAKKETFWSKATGGRMY